MAGNRASLQSFVSFRNSQGESGRGTLLKLDRTAVVFEVYNPYSIVQLSEVLQELSVRRGERIIYKGRAVVSNLVNTGLMLIVSTTLVDPWRDLEGLLDNAPKVREEASHFLSDWVRDNRLVAGYVLAVSRIRAFLSELNRWLSQLNMNESVQSRKPEQVLSDEVFDVMTASVFPKAYELFTVFEDEARQIDDSVVVAHRQYAQRDLHPLVLTAPFVHRTFTKPLGYAGDYEMVNMMLRSSREGPNTYAQIVNALHLNTGVAEGHRNRIRILRRYLEDMIANHASGSSRVRVLNIGCGPVHEIQQLVEEGGDIDRLDITLLDFNEETLEYASEVLSSLGKRYGRQVEFSCIHDSVHSLLKKAVKADHAEDRKQFDYIYCAGLFDYLSSKVCNRLLRLFYSWIVPGGVVVATNVHPANPNRFAMEHILEWHLVYRDESEMESLAPNLGKQRVFSDETRLNLILEIKKPDALHA